MLDLSLSPDTLDWNGTLYRTILATADTGGAMCVLDSVTPPGFGPPIHVHANEDETFVILSGELEFFLAGERFTKGPGETAHIPRGTEHTFLTIGDQPSRHLVILTPGGFEGFFREMAEGSCRIPEDMPAVLQSAEKHGMAFTGPPLTANGG